MEQLLAPEPLKDGNLSEGWKKFKRKFAQFLIATEKADASNGVKTSILIRVIGPRGNDIYIKTSIYQTRTKSNMTQSLNNLMTFANPWNIHSKTHTPMHETGWNETKLCTQAILCKFDALTEDLMCQALVEGLNERSYYSRHVRVYPHSTQQLKLQEKAQ